jgi:endogenous inhibitor of DNA gyrase (YacG/DUF329 family)
MSMVVTLQCNHCGKDFRQARHWQRFCSTRCRDAWHRHNYKLEEVKDAEAVRDAKKQLRKQIDGMQIVEALKYGRVEAAPAVAENGLRRRQLG